MLDCKKMLPQKNVKKLHDAYYSPTTTSYWRSKAAVTSLVGVPKSQCITWLSKQPIWQIYLPKPRKITYARRRTINQTTHIKPICCTYQKTVDISSHYVLLMSHRAIRKQNR